MPMMSMLGPRAASAYTFNEILGKHIICLAETSKLICWLHVLDPQAPTNLCKLWPGAHARGASTAEQMKK